MDGYFGELSIPLFRGASGAFLSSIELSAAGRHEKYEDFGSVDIPQGAIRFGFLDESLILRASYAEGFRAPTLDELDPPYPNILVGVYDPISTISCRQASSTAATTSWMPKWA